MGALTDAQFESTRRVRPGRMVQNREGQAMHKEEYATAVVGPDGDDVVPRSLESLLQETNRRLAVLAVHLASITGMEVSLSDAP